MSDEPVPTVSVVMAMHDAADTVERALRSCLGQTEGDLEIVVVDDGSDDDSAAVVASIADRRIRLETLPTNRGPASARNVALDRARGRWVTILDADDAYLEGRLERLLELATSLDDAHVLVDTTLPVVATPAGYASLVAVPEPITRSHRVLPPAAAVRAGVRGQPFFSRALLERTRARYPDGIRSGEDTAFLIQLLADPRARLVRVADPLYLYTHREDSLTRAPDRYEHRHAALRFLLDECALSAELHAEVESLLARLERDRVWETLRGAIRGRRFAVAAAIVLRHPGVVRLAWRLRRRHRAYRTSRAEVEQAGQSPR